MKISNADTWTVSKDDSEVVLRNISIIKSNIGLDSYRKNSRYNWFGMFESNNHFFKENKLDLRFTDPAKIKFDLENKLSRKTMNYSQRYEKKIFINFTEEKLNKKFDKIFELEFGQGYYCFSIYFDDFNLTTLKQKQEGTMERFKLRLRFLFF